MRTISYKIIFAMLIGVAVIAGSQTATAQEFRKELIKGIVQTIGPDAFKEMAKSVILELAKDEEFRKQVVQQVVRDAASAIGPENIKEIVKSATAETANSHVPKVHTAGIPAVEDVDSIGNALISIAGELTKDPAVVNALSSGGSTAGPQALLAVVKKKMADSSAMKMKPGPETTSVSRHFRNDLIAVITHPSNPVNSLTLDQVRKIFSGEYANWSQVGGTDMPIQLVTSRDPAALESLLDTHLAPSAARVPLLSFLFVGVAETEGAVGFLPTASIEQLEFIRTHGAIKKIAIRKDDHSPAFTLNPGAVLDGSYPLLARDAK